MNSTHNANKSRRNSCSNSTRRGLIPDTTMTYLMREIEIMVVESSKTKLNDDIRKNLNDTTKLAILMHDQLTKVYNVLSKEEKENEINKIEVYGICTSSN